MGDVYYDVVIRRLDLTQLLGSVLFILETLRRLRHVG